MALGTEFARDFCAGIGPLQLGVVLVLFTNQCVICHFPIVHHIKSVFVLLNSVANPAYLMTKQCFFVILVLHIIDPFLDDRPKERFN